MRKNPESLLSAYRTDEMVECKESEMRSEDPIAYLPKLGSVVGPVIQAKWRLSFEDDLRS